MGDIFVKIGVIGSKASCEIVKKSIKEHCEKNLSRYSLPYEYEFRKSLPKTLIGKVDFKKLSEEKESDA